jgi:hypothetical protein
VVVSADGRVITAIGTFACGRGPRLVARSYPGKVALILENPDRSCNVDEDAGAQYTAAKTELAAPLGDRALVRAGSTSGTIPYFSERDLATVRRVPFGLRLTSDEPVNATGPRGQPVMGDTRTYMSPRALIEITQVVPIPSVAARSYWFSTICPDLFGWNPPRGDGGCRTITWVTGGYHFRLGMAVERGMTLSAGELRAIAQGVSVHSRS